MASITNMKEVHDRARERLKDICRVCPICNGRSCISGVPGMGGKGRRTGFKRNIEAFEQILLNLRTIHNDCSIDTGYDLFGTTLAMPVLGAPMCETNYNFWAGSMILSLSIPRLKVPQQHQPWPLPVIRLTRLYTKWA